MSLESRLRKLEQAVGRSYSPDECPKKNIGAIVANGESVPENAPRCTGCGHVHVLRVKEVVVDRRVTDPRVVDLAMEHEDPE